MVDMQLMVEVEEEEQSHIHHACQHRHCHRFGRYFVELVVVVVVVLRIVV